MKLQASLTRITAENSRTSISVYSTDHTCSEMKTELPTESYVKHQYIPLNGEGQDMLLCFREDEFKSQDAFLIKTLSRATAENPT